MSSNRSKLEDKMQVPSGSSTSKEAGVKEMDGKSSKKKILVEKPQPADLSRPISSTKNIKYCVICLSPPSTFDMSHKRNAGLRFKMYKQLHASFGFPSAELKEFNFCCKGCFESVNHLHKLQEKPEEAEAEIKEVAVRIRTAVRTRTPVNLELAKSKAFGDCRSETVVSARLIEEESDDDNSLMEQQVDDKSQQTVTAHCSRSKLSKSDVCVSHPPLDPRLDSVDWSGCVICRSRPSAFDKRNKRLAELRFEVYKKLDLSYQLPTAESTEEEFRFCCETCFKAVDHLHNLQVKLGKFQAEIKAVVKIINNSILSRTPATLELGKWKDCGDRVGRQNRNGKTAARRKNGNSMIADDDFIKVEIKDEVKEEIIDQGIDHDEDNFMEQQEDVDQRRATGSSVFDKEAGSRNLSKSSSARNANGKSDGKRGIGTKLIEKKIPAWKRLLPSHEEKQKMLQILRARQLNEKQNQEKISESAQTAIISHESEFSNKTNHSANIPKSLIAVSLDSEKLNKLRAAFDVFLKTKMLTSPNNDQHKKEASLVPMLPKKMTLANCKSDSDGKSEKEQGISQQLNEASASEKLIRKNNQKNLKGKRQLRCYFCSKKFIHKYELWIHLPMHTLEQPFKCEARFQKVAYQYIHIALVHDGIKPFKCTFKKCSYRTGRKPDLTRHKRTHTKNKPFICSICKVSFSQISNRNSHVNTIHKKLKTHNCTRKGCSSRFLYFYQLRNHISKDHKKFKPYICTVNGCSRRFYTSQGLSVHLNVHKGLKPFACTFDGCGFRTVYKPSFIAHLQTHGPDAEKWFGCSKCQKRFASKSNFLRHQNNCFKCKISKARKIN